MNAYIRHPWRKPAHLFLVALLAGFMVGCNNLLDVNNPNNVLEENLNDPAAASAIANGVLSTGSNGIGYCLAPYTTVTDEGLWIGSRDAWNQLDKGNVGDFNNEFLDAAWPFITEARYTADNAIARLEAFRSANTLRDPKNLARAYLYSALIRVTIADMFDDFVYSNKQEAKPPIGEANMAVVYDEAIAQLNTAYDIAQALTGNARDQELERRILGMRARAKHAKAVWQKVNPKPVSAATLANPYVTEGADDAQAALAIMTPNYRRQRPRTSSTRPSTIRALSPRALSSRTATSGAAIAIRVSRSSPSVKCSSSLPNRKWVPIRRAPRVY
jgi:hypothetical protein